MRTKEEKDGIIVYPKFLKRVWYVIREYMALPNDLMIKVDMNCFDRAKVMITNEMLDVRFIGDQTRQNYWLKDLFFTKIQLRFLEGSYRKLIDPRSETYLKKMI